MASNNFINECKTPAYEDRLGKIVIDGVEYNQGNYLTNLEIDNNIYNNGTIIGNTYTKSLKFSLINVNKDTAFVGKKAIPSVGVKYNNNATEYITFDEFTIEALNDEQTKNFTDITGYDSLNILDTKYVCGLSEGAHTIGEYWADLVSGLGLQTNTSTFTNSTISIPANPFINNETYRTVLSEIEKVSCTYSKIEKVDNQNYINLYWLDLAGNPVYEFETSDYSTLEGSLTKYGPVNCVILGNPDIGGENVFLQDDESIAQNGETKIVINAEYFLYTQALREQAIQGIYNKLLGFQYYDLSLTTLYGKPFLEVGNKIRVNTNEGNIYDTYILSHTFTYDGTFKSVIKSPSFTKQENIVKSTESISSRMKKTEIMVDKANQKITSVVADVDDLGERTTQVEQDLEGLSVTVSRTETIVEDLEDSIDYFTVSITQENIVIPVYNNQKPYTSATYSVGYTAKFKGETVTPTVQISGTETGITKSSTSSQIRFATNTSTAIANKDYTYTVNFSYVNGGVTYTSSKKITLILSIQGEQGEQGGSGRGISSIDYRYATTTTQTAPEASTVTSTTIPTLSSTNKYLWQKETINYTSGDPKITVSLIGVYGDTGNQGPAGQDGASISITTKTVTYKQGDNGTTPPTGTWSSTVPTVEKGKYLWTKTYVKYSDNTETTSYSVAYNAKDGENGQEGPQGPAGTSVTITTKTVQYQIGNSGTTAPTGTWSNTVPTLVAQKYLWTKTYVKYSDNNEVTSYSVSYIAKDGTDGTNGSDGRGIASATVTYQKSTSGTVTPTGTWSATIPSVGAGEYLWTRTVTNYTTGNPTTSYSVGMMGQTGGQGPAGSSISITTKTVTYQIGTSGTSAPTGTWSSTVPAQQEGKYLWTKTYVKYSDNNETTSYSVSYCASDGEQGPAGQDGKSVSSIIEEYYLSTSKTTQTGGSWVTTPPTWEQGKYIWTRSKITYTNPSSTTYTVPIVSSEWEATNIAYDAIQSRGEQLIVNGSGLIGDNTNFSWWTFDKSEAYGSAGSFTSSRNGAPSTDEFFPVNPDKTYRFSHYMKSQNGLMRFYDMVRCYDVDKLEIMHNQHMYGADSELARDLKNGDTVVYLTDLSTWKRDTGTRGYERGFIFWNYKNSGGYQYPVHTYSRNVYQFLYEDANVNYTNNTITLTSAWNKGTFPAGTKLSQSNSGGNYKYIHNNVLIPTTWTSYTGTIGTVDYSGTNAVGKFPPATAYCKVGWLWNYNNVNDTAWVSNVSFTEDLATYQTVQKTVKQVDVEYYLSTSSTSTTGGSWSVTAPTWVDGKYMWSRQKVTYVDGTTATRNATCIAGAKGATGSTGPTGPTGTGVSSITAQYYVSTSKTTQTGGSWIETSPTWQSGKYIWTRNKIVYTNPASTVYTTPVCSSEWEAVNEINVGGRNYFLKANTFTSGGTGASGITPSIEEGLWKIVVASGNGNWNSWSHENIIEDNFSEGDTFTFSLEIKSENASTTTPPQIYFKNGMGYYRLTGSVSSEWSRVYYTGTWKDTNNIAFHLGWSGLVGTYYIRKLKFESGNKATDWTPAIEDKDPIYTHTMFSEDGTTFVPEGDYVVGDNTVHYQLGKKPSRYQGTFVDNKVEDSTTFGDYIWIDTSQYNREELDNLDSEIQKRVTTNDFQSTIEGLTNVLTSSGGTNLVRDSMGVLNDGSWVNANDEAINVESTNADFSVGGSAIVVGTTKIIQKIRVKNGTYTLSFKYRKLASTGILTAKLGDYSTNISNSMETDDGYTQTITVSSNLIVLSFQGNVANTGYIYDLMLNSGTKVKAWEQNQNETTTDTVKIGKGIVVKSSSQNTTSKMNADGFRVTSNNDNQDVMKATDKGGWFRELETTSTSNINGALFINIDGHVWITGTGGNA